MTRKRSRKFLNNVLPNVYMARSEFDLSYDNKSAFNVGKLIPFYIQEIYPGDTIKTKSTFVLRTSVPFVRPVLDNLFFDMYYLFVPHRLAYSRWNEVMGENVSGYWTSSSDAEVPGVALPLANADGGAAIDPESIASYFGINIDDGLPVGSTEVPFEVSDIPFRDYALIYNEWFRNENFEAPAYVNIGDYANRVFINRNDWSVSNIHGKVASVNKLSDYFTMCLPEPQKGDAVDIPISDAPVVPIYGADNKQYLNDDYSDLFRLSAFNSAAGEWRNGNYVYENTTNGNILTDDTGTRSVAPMNLMSLNSLSIGNINDLRFAFQMQKMLEKDARGGTRYVEYLASHFGVVSPDARLQRPEFLGGKRVPLQFQEVAQTSSSTESSPMAQLSAYSATVERMGFSKGFVEHGFVIGVGCVRYRHTYQQGIERFWTRRNRYDFYDPVFANIGEQPIYRYEIYANQLHAGNANTIFGYNEAWADLRTRQSRITGMMNSVANNGLDVWHFGDYYSNAPVLSDAFMKETGTFVDRTLSAGADAIPNFIIDIYHKVKAARVLPLYSIPGLVDHH